MIHAADPRQCVVLVPAGGAIDPGCDDGLRELERRGYPVWRVRGYAAIDAARNQGKKGKKRGRKRGRDS